MPRKQKPVREAPVITDTLTMTLSSAEWQMILEGLSNGPWRVVNPLIRKIMDTAEKVKP